MKTGLLAMALVGAIGVSAEVSRPSPDEVKAIPRSVADRQVATFDPHTCVLR